MAAATLAELIDRVLQKLSVLEGGETAEAEDAALIQVVVLSVNEQLRTKEIAHWSDAAFPQDIKEDLADYIACHAVDDYPSTKNLTKFDERKKQSSLAKLRALTSSSERVDRQTRADYF